MRARMFTAAAVAMVAANGAVARATDLTIDTSPALWPPHRADVPHYTVRCEAGPPRRVEASIPPGQSVAVDGGPPAHDSLEQDVSLEPGQAFTFTVTDGDSSATHDVRCLPPDFP